MQEEELFIPQSILQSEDFDTIKSAVFKKFKNSPAGVQSWAAQCLHTYRQNDIYWGPVVTKMLIFLATAKDGQIKQGDLTQATSLWLSRISDLGMSKRSLPKDAALSVDCLYFLYKMKIITPTQVCCFDPVLWARFASLFSVHDFMNIKHNGRSPVYTYLDQRKNTKKAPEALDGLEKLFELYKSDFKYIISPDLAELQLIEEFNTHGTTILKFLKNTELYFPAIDNAYASLYEAIIMIYWRHPVKKPAKLTGMQKFLRIYSEKRFRQMGATNNAQIARKIMPELQWYLVQAYESANKQPNETFNLPSGFTSTSQFPLHMLPMEVIESILSESHTDELVRSIFCLSKGCSHLKRSFDWRRFLKKQFPLKYHVVNETLAENPKFKWNHYCMVQNRFRSNWSAAKFSKFIIPGMPYKMDDNLLVGCSNRPHIDDENIESDEILFFAPNDHEGSFELTKDHVGYYWINWNDTKDYYKVNYFAPDTGFAAKMCLVDSVAEVPKIALVFRHDVEIWEGSQMIVKNQTPILNEYIGNPYYHKSSLFIGPYEYRLDNNMARRQVLLDDECVMDIGRTNNLMITEDGDYKLTIKSQTDYQTIASISSPYTEHTSAVFLDDSLFAAYWQGKIQLFDVRNMGAAVSQIDLSSCKHRFGALDGPNQRATSESDAGSIVHIWNLKTCKWTTAFETEIYSEDYLINARYLCTRSADDTTIVFDFTNTKEY